MSEPMVVCYTKWHDNYPFKLGELLYANKYKDGWLLIDGQLWRSECFEEVGESSE